MEGAKDSWVRVSPYSRYLIALGLGDEASFEAASQRYQWLLRTWLPERYNEGDRRRLEAEVKTREINNAFRQLKKLKYQYKILGV